MQKFVTYCRVSTTKQGRSGLGLDAQRRDIANYINNGKAIAEFVEVETGKHEERPQLQKALHRAKVTGATLVIAKLDRLSRNVRFIAELQESKVRFVCCDMPDANELTIHIFASLAQWERKMISERTKKALAAAKQRGVVLGNPMGLAVLQRAAKGNLDAVSKLIANANARANDVIPIVNDIRASGVTSLLGIANELNERGILTARGGQWYATTVKNLLARAEPKSCGTCDLHSEEADDGFGICNLEIARRTRSSHLCDCWKPRA